MTRREIIEQAHGVIDACGPHVSDRQLRAAVATLGALVVAVCVMLPDNRPDGPGTGDEDL